MAHQVEWTNYILDTFLKELKRRETNAEDMAFYETIMRTRCMGWVRTRQAIHCHTSLSSVDRAIKYLKMQYDIIQKEKPELNLPIRRISNQEIYMDTH